MGQCYRVSLMETTLLCLCATACFIPGGQSFGSDMLPAYQTQVWEPGVTLVWAQPGTSGEISDPNRWNREDGTAARKAPDRNTDIVLPAAETIYLVTGNRTDQIRHATIERNAHLAGRHRNEVEIWGNCWAKAGAYVTFVAIRGDKHTFFRMDDAEFPSPENGHVYAHPSTTIGKQRSRSQISHKFQVCKFGTASVEFIGNIGVSDEVMVQHGKMIISGDFRYNGVTGKGSFEVYDGGILELQSGGRLAPFDSGNNKNVYNINVYRNGVIQAGSPERPLTDDAYLLLGFAENDEPGYTGLYSALGSMIRVYTTDPNRARLVISSVTSDPEFRDGRGRLVGEPGQKAQGNLGISLQLAGDVSLDGMYFDYVAQGGIALIDPERRRQWRHISFGPHCAGPANDLFASLAVNPNAYYHQRGDEVSEYGLIVRAVEAMADYLTEYDPFQISTSPPSSHMAAVPNSTFERPVATIFEQPTAVTISVAVPGARIRYTTDGTEPTAQSPLYTEPIVLGKTTRLMIKAYRPGVGFSPTYSTTYVFK